MKKLLPLILGAVALLSGCFPNKIWLATDEKKDYPAMQADRAFCLGQSSLSGAAGSGDLYAMAIAANTFNACMEGKGYLLVPEKDLQSTAQKIHAQHLESAAK